MQRTAGRSQCAPGASRGNTRSSDSPGSWQRFSYRRASARYLCAKAPLLESWPASNRLAGHWARQRCRSSRYRLPFGALWCIPWAGWPSSIRFGGWRRWDCPQPAQARAVPSLGSVELSRTGMLFAAPIVLLQVAALLPVIVAGVEYGRQSGWQPGDLPSAPYWSLATFGAMCCAASHGGLVCAPRRRHTIGAWKRAPDLRGASRPWAGSRGR